MNARLHTEPLSPTLLLRLLPGRASVVMLA
jgi:hypothetical protein